MRRVLIILIMALKAGSGLFAADLYCWIIGDANGNCHFTPSSVSNLVSEVNGLYRQVAMSFDIKEMLFTNDVSLTAVDLSNELQKAKVCAIGSGTEGLELYFVNELRGRATAVHRSTGIIIGPSANGRTLGHEIGHACGLPDVYDFHRETTLSITGAPTKDRMPNDWGWYPTNVTQKMVVSRLLMYGYSSAQKADLSYGDVYGLHYTSSWNRVTRRRDKFWELSNAPIGFGLHGNRHPVSQ